MLSLGNWRVSFEGREANVNALKCADRTSNKSEERNNLTTRFAIVNILFSLKRALCSCVCHIYDGNRRLIRRSIGSFISISHLTSLDHQPSFYDVSIVCPSPKSIIDAFGFKQDGSTRIISLNSLYSAMLDISMLSIFELAVLLHTTNL